MPRVTGNTREQNMMFRMTRVMNSITQVMRLIIQFGENGAEKIRERIEDFRLTSQHPANPAFSWYGHSARFSDWFGTEFALEQTALKIQITILERREQ